MLNLQQMKNDWFQLQKNEGFDIYLIEYNLSLPYEERLRQHDDALTLQIELQKQGKTLHPKKAKCDQSE